MANKVRHIIPISGKDSLATAIVQMKREPKLDYEYVFCDVKMELPETYAWIDKVEKTLGIKIRRIGLSLERVIAQAGMLPSFARRFCTTVAKIGPLTEYMEENGDKVIQYIGFRADEKDRIPPSKIEKNIAESRYPLIEEGVDLVGVYDLLNQQKILPPSFFWGRLYDAVLSQVSGASKRFMEDAKPWTISYLFSWRSRSNCYSCFYQRLYEWVGLLEYHPDLFERAAEIEAQFGGARSEFRIESKADIKQENDFYWNPYYPLSEIKRQASRIFDDRVEAVRKEVVGMRHQSPSDLDRLSATSCGAYCGK